MSSVPGGPESEAARSDSKAQAPLRYGGGISQEARAPLELQDRGNGELAASGALTFATARGARELGLAAIRAATAPAIQIDCTAISASDSAGMCVLLDWLSAAIGAQRSLHYRNLPPQVQAIARISDVLELLERGV